MAEKMSPEEEAEFIKVTEEMYASEDHQEALDELDNWFTHHPPFGDQASRYELLRELGHNLATGIIENCPEGADRSAAIRKVREAVMTANAAIACGEVDPSTQMDLDDLLKKTAP